MLDINPQFQQALDLLEDTTRPVFITGKAGAGKSTLLEHFQKTTQKNPVLLAPTGVAALNVGGQTIHSFFGFSPSVNIDKILGGKQKPRDPTVFKRLQLLIIDEVSMLRADLLDCIDAFLRLYGPKISQPFGGVQLALVGDLYQLPPVVTRDEQTYFNTTYPTPYFFSAQALTDPEVASQLALVTLEKIYRQQDQAFIDLLNKVRTATANASDIATLNQQVGPAPAVNQQENSESNTLHITLTTTNKAADTLNEERLATLDSKVYTSYAKVKGDVTKDYYPTAPQLQFKIGAQVMMLNNDAKGRWVNGSLGIIKGYKKHPQDGWHVKIWLEDSNDIAQVYAHNWEVYQFKAGGEGAPITAEMAGSFSQFPFRLAWAITIHKSQGKTFNEVVIDMGWGAFASGQTYVALSRCTSLEGITLLSPLKRKDLRIDPLIEHFMQGGAKAITLYKAIAEQQTVKVDYEKQPGEVLPLTLTPAQLQTEEYQGKSYYGVRAYAEELDQRRVFDVAKIKKVQVVPMFDLAVG